MPSTLKSLVAAFAIVGIATAAAAQSTYEKPPARTVHGRGGNSLTPPSNASPRAVLVAFLREQGRDQSTADSVVEGARSAGRNGISHVQFWMEPATMASIDLLAPTLKLLDRG